MNRLEQSQELLADRERLSGVIADSRDEEVLDQVSQHLGQQSPRLLAWTDVAGDYDGWIQTGLGYKESQIWPLAGVHGAGAAPEAFIALRREIIETLINEYAGRPLDQLIKIVENDKFKGLPHVEKTKVLEALKTRLVFLINSNPREARQALLASNIYNPIRNVIDPSFNDEVPNGLPWAFSAGGYSEGGGANVNTLSVFQGWPNYSPLPDIDAHNLQVYGLLGTATDVYKILFDKAQKIQFSSRYAPRAAEQVLRDKVLESIVWAVPDFVKRYLEDKEFRLLADTVLRLCVRESWISYPDGFGNLIGQERYDVDSVRSAVDSAKLDSELDLVISGNVFKVLKVNCLTEAEPGHLVIYNNGEDTKSNFNIATPWIANNATTIAKATFALLRQGVSAINLTAEIVRAKAVAAKDGESFLRLNAHSLLRGVETHLGFNLAGSEVRVLSQGSAKSDLADAVDCVRVADKFTGKDTSILPKFRR